MASNLIVSNPKHIVKAIAAAVINETVAIVDDFIEGPP
jgi:hypothetical protein